MNARTTSNRNGQALIELVIALIAAIALLAALVQIGWLTREQLISIQEAREQADQAALSDFYSFPSRRPDAIRDWNAGPDRIRHSRDDTAVSGNQDLFLSEIVVAAQPIDLSARIRGNPISALVNAGSEAIPFQAVRGEAEARTVPMLPAARRLLYDTDSIILENEVWMPWTRGVP